MSLITQGIFGFFAIFLFCAAISEKRRQIQLMPIIKGIIVQLILAFLILKFTPIREFFHWIGDGVNALREATIAGTSFVFGYMGGGEAPFVASNPNKLFVFAFQALPLLIVVSAIAMLLFYWRILPVIVQGLSWFFRKTLSVGGALGVCSGAKIFLGQTEAPLLIKPYLNQMNRGEIFTIMTLGLATTSGTILAIYASILEPAVPHVLTHIITASIINIPAAITLSRMVIPHGELETSGKVIMPYEFSSAMDSITKGTGDGLKLFLNVVAMLIVFIALVALVNKILGCFPDWGDAPVTLQRLLGYVMAPVTWLMGIPASEITVTGALLGIKTILNEMYAYTELAGIAVEDLSPSSRVIMTYALCGFANISSIGILIGGLGGMAPERRPLVIELGWKALLIGTLSSCLSGTIVGLILHIF